MKREDIQYFNSWAKSFKKATPAIIMRGLLEGIWVNSNKDPEDIYLVFPKLITEVGSPEVMKHFGQCPFEFSFEDSETYHWEKEGRKHCHKGRMMFSYGESWTLDKYEMRKAVTKTGLWYAKKYKITKEEVEALHKKYGWDDEAAYKELMTNRPDLMLKSSYSDFKYAAIDADDYKYIRAAFCPHFDTMYNWMDYPEKAGYPEIPNIDNRDYDWEAE